MWAQVLRWSRSASRPNSATTLALAAALLVRAKGLSWSRGMHGLGSHGQALIKHSWFAAVVTVSGMHGVVAEPSWRSVHAWRGG